MYVGQVTGTVVATIKHEAFYGRKLLVVVRLNLDGDPTGEYVYAGDRVTVLATATDAEGGEWVRIAEPAGWIWAGCLEGSQRGCIAE